MESVRAGHQLPARLPFSPGPVQKVKARTASEPGEGTRGHWPCLPWVVREVGPKPAPEPAPNQPKPPQSRSACRPAPSSTALIPDETAAAVNTANPETNPE